MFLKRRDEHVHTAYLMLEPTKKNASMRIYKLLAALLIQVSNKEVIDHVKDTSGMLWPAKMN